MKVDSSNRLSYALTNKSYYNDPCGHISFWFKSDTTSSSSTKKYLFSLHTSYVGNHISLGNNILFPDFIGVYLKYKRIYLEVIDGNGKYYDLITSDYEVDLSKWNFVSLNFINRCDGQGYTDVCEYGLVVNAHRQKFVQKDPRIYVDCDPNPVMNIGHKFDGYTSSNDFTGKITGLLIGKRTYLSDDTITKFYRLSKDYIIDNQLIDTDVKAVDFSQTNLFSINQSILELFDIYPLQNNVLSLNDKRPIKFNIRKLSNLDKDRTFNFNSTSKKYAYVADGEELIYEFNQSGGGTIGMRAFTDVIEDKQYLFEAKDSEEQILGLYRDSSMYLVIDVNGKEYKTNLKFENNKWQAVMFSFKEDNGSSSNPGSSLNIRICIDGKTWYKTVNSSIKYKNLNILVGRKYKKYPVSMAIGIYYTTYPLHGQIEMLVTRSAYCELSTLNTLIDELKGLTKISEFDELGMLKKVDVHECGKSILSNTYDYKRRSSSSKYISKQISEEIIRCGSNTISRNYETDPLGNITKITDNTFGSHDYKYDARGFLIEADSETYSYDENGNIVKKGNFISIYDSTIKDRLVSFYGVKIEYDPSNPLNPKSYGDNTYKFEGRRLTKLSFSNSYYDYIYNDQGLRIKKVDDKGNAWDYIYDGNKLITEISNKGRLDYLYNENSCLYGFLKDKTEKYLYIRDSLQTILGIATMNGEIIVKYSYDAWGLIRKIEDSSTSNIGD